MAGFYMDRLSATRTNTVRLTRTRQSMSLSQIVPLSVFRKALYSEEA